MLVLHEYEVEEGASVFIHFIHLFILIMNFVTVACKSYVNHVVPYCCCLQTQSTVSIVNPEVE